MDSNLEPKVVKPKTKKPGSKTKWLIIGLAIIVVIGIAIYLLMPTLKKKEIYRPKEDAVSRALPPNAATGRLNLPVPFSSLVISKNSGLGGLGIDTDDTNQTDYVTMDIKSGTQIQSMSAGQVTKVNKVGEENFEVILNFSYGLWGRYQKMKEVTAKEGENVREGQEIGKGTAGSQQGTDVVVFSLADENREVGKKSAFSNGVIVAPLDYLKPDVKARVLEKYE